MATRITITQSALNAAPDKAKYLNERLAKATERSVVILPNGKFFLFSTLHVSRGIVIEGSQDTLLVVMHAGPAIVFRRNGPTGRAAVRNVQFLNGLNENNSRAQHGIQSHMPITIEDCIIDNVWGDGIHLTADGGNLANVEALGMDVSFCNVRGNVIRGCKGNGIYIQGGDSNASHFERNDTRDCLGYGVHDASFLGNHFISHMAHLNARGNYMASDANNRTLFTGCYSEGGSPQSYMHGAAMIVGGLWDGMPILEANATAQLDGKQYNSKTPYPYSSWVDYRTLGTGMVKVFERVDKAGKGVGSYQWRLYNKDGDVFVNKSDTDLPSIEAAYEAALKSTKQ